ncbi:hypothetical protein [Rhodanobacter aciditrophus]|uniref:hypothetical protein n=1 Tax=Rhodanobacter aciditrophus TaxID=1623218 RepID=UPI003CF72DAC
MRQIDPLPGAAFDAARVDQGRTVTQTGATAAGATNYADTGLLSQDREISAVAAAHRAIVHHLGTSAQGKACATVARDRGFCGLGCCTTVAAGDRGAGIIGDGSRGRRKNGDAARTATAPSLNGHAPAGEGGYRRTGKAAFTALSPGDQRMIRHASRVGERDAKTTGTTCCAGGARPYDGTAGGATGAAGATLDLAIVRDGDGIGRHASASKPACTARGSHQAAAALATSATGAAQQ